MFSTYKVRPRLGKIPAATAYSGRSRTRLYQWAEQHEGLFKKDGASTLVDFDILDEILDQLPVAVINVSAAKDEAPEPLAGVSAPETSSKKSEGP